MVRLLPLRHRRGAGVRRTVLPEERSGRRHPALLPDLWRRFRVPTVGRHHLRHPRRSLWPQARIGRNAADDRSRHHRDRLLADLFSNRRLGPHPAGRDADRAGAWRRRRIWRRGDLSGRERACEPSRLLGRLCAARRFRRQSAGGRSVRSGVDAAARRDDELGMAPAVPRELRPDPGRALCPPADHRNTGFHRSGPGPRHGREEPGDGSDAPPSAQLPGRARRPNGGERVGLLLPGVRAQLCHQDAGRSEFGSAQRA